MTKSSSADWSSTGVTEVCHNNPSNTTHCYLGRYSCFPLLALVRLSLGRLRLLSFPLAPSPLAFLSLQRLLFCTYCSR